MSYRRPGEGQGRVFLRGRRYWISFYSAGTEHRESAGATESEARELLRTRLAQVELQQFTPRPHLTVSDLLTEYRAHLSVREGGARLGERLESALNVTERAFGTWPIADVTPARLERWAAGLMAPTAKHRLKPGSVRSRLAYLSAAFSLAYRRGLIERRPHILVVAEPDNARQGFFTAPQFATLLPHLPEYLRAVARFAYLSGWRRSEILGMTWAEVDLSAGVVTLPAGRSKNGHARVLPLVGELLALLRERWQARAIGLRIVPFVFHRLGQRIGRYDSAWHTACVEAGMPGRLFHDLRRSAIRNFVRAGVTETVAMQISGHRDRRVFERYNVSSTADVTQALERASAYLSIGRTIDALGPDGQPGRVVQLSENVGA
jgi:integrase